MTKRGLRKKICLRVVASRFRFLTTRPYWALILCLVTNLLIGLMQGWHLIFYTVAQEIIMNLMIRSDKQYTASGDSHDYIPLDSCLYRDNLNIISAP